MFAASTVRRAIGLKAPFLQCVKYFHTISCVDLLGKIFCVTTIFSMLDTFTLEGHAFITVNSIMFA